MTEPVKAQTGEPALNTTELLGNVQHVSLFQVKSSYLVESTCCLKNEFIV